MGTIAQTIPDRCIQRLLWKLGDMSEDCAGIEEAIVVYKRTGESGVPQLIALLAHVSTNKPCSAAFDLVRIARSHRYTLCTKDLALSRYL